MKVKFILEEAPTPTEVTIKGQSTHPEIQKLKRLFQQFQGTTVAKKDDNQFRLNLQEIYYVESQEEKTIIFTKDDSYLSTLKLYEIESWGDPFVRISKSVILNFQYLQSFKPLFNSKLEATLTNGDRVEVSRNYLPIIKAKLQGGQP
jgi:DNA-binding LytR/AlgR family response regulator